MQRIGIILVKGRQVLWKKHLEFPAQSRLASNSKKMGKSRSQRHNKEIYSYITSCGAGRLVWQTLQGFFRSACLPFVGVMAN